MLTDAKLKKYAAKVWATAKLWNMSLSRELVEKDLFLELVPLQEEVNAEIAKLKKDVADADARVRKYKQEMCKLSRDLKRSREVANKWKALVEE